MKRNDPNRYDTSTIKPRRLAAGLTQMKLAAAVGVELNTLRSWEKDWNAPNPENAARLDAVLDPTSYSIYLAPMGTDNYQMLFDNSSGEPEPLEFPTHEAATNIARALIDVENGTLNYRIVKGGNER